jgi:hypothetical protein
MALYNSCPESGNDLGELKQFVEVVKQGYILVEVIQKEEYKDIEPSKTDLVISFPLPNGLFDALEINNLCCRKAMMS